MSNTMSVASCSVCDLWVEGIFVERTPGNVEMKCPSCDMWVYGYLETTHKTLGNFNISEIEKISDIKKEARIQYELKTKDIIKQKVDYYLKKA